MTTPHDFVTFAVREDPAQCHKVREEGVRP